MKISLGDHIIESILKSFLSLNSSFSIKLFFLSFSCLRMQDFMISLFKPCFLWMQRSDLSVLHNKRIMKISVRVVNNTKFITCSCNHTCCDLTRTRIQLFFSLLLRFELLLFLNLSKFFSLIMGDCGFLFSNIEFL